MHNITISFDEKKISNFSSWNIFPFLQLLYMANVIFMKDFPFRQRFSGQTLFTYTQPEKKNFFFISSVIRHFDFSRRELFFRSQKIFDSFGKHHLIAKNGLKLFTIMLPGNFAFFPKTKWYKFSLVKLRKKSRKYSKIYNFLFLQLAFCGGQFWTHTLVSVKHSTETEFRD